MPRINQYLSGGRDPGEPKPPEFELSPQQEAVIRFVRLGPGNAILVAVAGSGKTTTLVELCKHLQGKAAFAAFNKRIADEIQTKLLRAGVNKRAVKAATFHSFGFSSWRTAAPRVRVDGDKLYHIMRELDINPRFFGFVGKLVSLAKQHTIGVADSEIEDWDQWMSIVEHFDLEEKLIDEHSYGKLDELVHKGVVAAQIVLMESISRDQEVIDFDDMIYCPLYHDTKLWRNDWVLIDEAQDTNPARRMLAAKMLKPSGRLIAVGDPRQAIYGFTGASADALDQIASSFKPCKRLPLTVTFRCAKRIVDHANEIVSHIEAHEDAPEGKVSKLSYKKFKQVRPSAQDAVLCRVNRPLVELAFHYIRNEVPCHIEGRDLGRTLTRLAMRWKSIETAGELSEQLRDYKEKEEARLADKPGKLAALYDKVETLQVVIEHVGADAPVTKVVLIIQDLFRDTEAGEITSVTLSTVHKAKGREWDRVYILGRNKWMPHPMAQQLWQVEQEHNLMYVAITRAKNELIEIKVP